MIHKFTDIHPNARIGGNVKIGAFTSIEEDVEIGAGTQIGANVTILNGSRIGENCKIFPGAVIGGEPQDIKFSGIKTIAVIGDNSVLREYVTVNRGSQSKGQTLVGSNCYFMAYAHVAHDCIVGDNVILVNSVHLAGEVEIDDWAIISGISAIHQFVKVGKHVMLSGGSVLGRDIPPYIVAARRHPVAYKGVNVIGMRRRGFSNEQIAEAKDIYRVLFQNELNFKNAFEKIKSEFADSVIKSEIINFINRSNRGLIKGFNSND